MPPVTGDHMTIYGMSPMKLQEQLWNEMHVKVSEDEAKKYLDGFFVTYPDVKTYMDNTRMFAENVGVAYTYLGRRRRFPALQYMERGRERLARQAINARIQSTSSDLVMNNLNSLAGWLETIGGRVLITVHDSIVFQAPSGSHSGMMPFLKRCVTEETARLAPWLPVEWKFDCGWGPNYGDTHGDVS